MCVTMGHLNYNISLFLRNKGAGGIRFVLLSLLLLLLRAKNSATIHCIVWRMLFCFHCLPKCKRANQFSFHHTHAKKIQAQLHCNVQCWCSSVEYLSIYGNVGKLTREKKHSIARAHTAYYPLHSWIFCIWGFLLRKQLRIVYIIYTRRHAHTHRAIVGFVYAFIIVVHGHFNAV